MSSSSKSTIPPIKRMTNYVFKKFIGAQNQSLGPKCLSEIRMSLLFLDIYQRNYLTNIQTFKTYVRSLGIAIL